MRVGLRLALASGVAFAISVACTRPSPARTAPDAGVIVARWAEGELSLQQLRKEAGRLPPGLRTEFQSPGGEEQLARSLVDKQLLFSEARRRGLVDAPEVQQQVRELETRLAVSALLAAEEKSAGAATEAELRGYYDAHQRDFEVPARVHVARVLVRAPAESAQKARTRINGFRARVLKGEAVALVAKQGDGLERTVGGDIGWLDNPQNPQHAAALALKKPGEPTAVLESPDGLVFFALLERQDVRTPPFEEVKARVEGRLAPQRQRKSFDTLLARLREKAHVTYFAKTP